MGFKQTLKLFYKFTKPFRYRILAGLFCLLSVDILTIYPPLILKKFVDQAEKTFAGDLTLSPYVRLSLLYALVAFVQGILRYFWREFLVKSSHRAAEIIRDAYFSKLQRLPSTFFQTRSIGDLMALATNDVEAMRFAFGPGLLVFADAIFLFIALPPAMFALSFKLSIYTLTPMLFLPVFIFWAEKKVHERFGKVQEQFSALTGFAQEDIEGIKIVKAFNREWAQLARFSEIGKIFVKLNVNLSKIQGLFDPVFLLAVALGFSSLILFAGPQVMHGELSIGTFVAFTRYLDLLVWPLTAFGLAVNYYQRGKSSLIRIENVLAREEESFGYPEKYVHFRAGGFDTPLLEARNLNFTYDEKQILKNINFKIDEGEWCALVGPVGAGKSTLVKIIAGLYRPERGMLFWKGIDVTEIPLQQRRKEISWVPQDVLLFSDSLGKNIFLGDQTKDLLEELEFNQETLERFHHVIDRAGLRSDLAEWDHFAEIGERGANLSGGEKSRVTLARAFIRNAPLLMLDDALSNIDAETETRILYDLAKHKANAKALIMISHRFSNIHHFDRIFVLQNGDLIQSGTPHVLAREKGLYRELLELQRMEDQLNG